MGYIRYFKDYLRYLKKTYDSSREIQALHLLSDVLQSIPKDLPHTGSALSFRALQIISADLLINKRSLIVELGTGYSTLFLSKFCALRGLETRVIAIEENEGWSQMIKAILEREGLLNQTEVLFSPIKDAWYDKDVITAALQSERPDVLLIDGPVASEISDIRSQALPFFADKLDERRMIVLDDIDRKSEYEMMQQDQKQKHSTWHVDGTTAYHLTGDHYNIF